MKLTTAARRIGSSIAAVGLLSLATAVPAAAVPDPGPPVSQGSTAQVREVVIHEDGAGVDFVQIGLGAAGGLAVAGAVAALGSRRRGIRLVNHPA